MRMNQTVLSIASFCVLALLSGCDKLAQNQLDGIKAKVAEDAVKQYEIARSSGGNAIDICVQAGLVSAAYLQAQDQTNYAIWKSRETADCSAAGIPK